MPAAPPKLYKYMPIETARAVLANRTLRWSTPRKFNDPFDMQLPLVLEIEDEAVVAVALEKISIAFDDDNFTPANEFGIGLSFLKASGVKLNRGEVDDEFKEALREGMSKLRAHLPVFNAEMIDGLSDSKILCLSEDPLISTMWSHYAEDHRGVVLEFGTPAGVDSPWNVARPIHYRAAAPNFADADFLANVLAGSADFDHQTTIDMFVYSKSSEWEYEKEWRIFSGSGRNREADFEDISFHPEELKAIVFGCRATNQTVTEFSKLAKAINPAVSVRQVERAGINLAFRQ